MEELSSGKCYYGFKMLRRGWEAEVIFLIMIMVDRPDGTEVTTPRIVIDVWGCGIAIRLLPWYIYVYCVLAPTRLVSGFMPLSK